MKRGDKVRVYVIQTSEDCGNETRPTFTIEETVLGTVTPKNMQEIGDCNIGELIITDSLADMPYRKFQGHNVRVYKHVEHDIFEEQAFGGFWARYIIVKI